MGQHQSIGVAKSAPVNPADVTVEYKLQPGQTKFFTTDATKEQVIMYSKKGVNARKSVTSHEIFLRAVKKSGDKLALATEPDQPLQDGGKTVPPPLPLEQWKKWTYKQYYEETCNAAKGFIKLGFKEFDAVTVFGYNSPEWFMSQYASQFAGGKVSGVYPSDSPEQVQFKALISDSSIATCEGEKELKAFKKVLNDLPYLKAIICWAFDPKGTVLKRSDGSSVPCFSWKELIAIGSKESDAELKNRIAQTKPGHCCALVFTSGTTGNPKATMISYDNVFAGMYTVLDGGVQQAGRNGAERSLSYLPLSHVAGMLMDIVCPIYLTADRQGWGETYFARPYDLKVGSLGARLNSVRPTTFLGVPRVWEKVAEKLRAIGAANSPLMKMIGDAAKSRGLEAAKNRQVGGNGESPFGMFLAHAIGNKIKQALGLEQCHTAISGAAPLSYDIQTYFASLGITIKETYGMSECTGATTWSTDDLHLWGSVGFVLPGHEVKIFKVNDDGSKVECPRASDAFKPTEAEQGEVCFRGRHIMMGYMANPKLGADHVAEVTKKNEEAIDSEGWLHSGDKGTMSKSGFVRITGRFKELIKGAGGENVAPVPIEDEIKRLCPAINNCMMVGDKRKYNICLVTLKAVGATGELPGGDDLEQAAIALCSPGITKISQAVNDPKLIKAISDAISATNKNGAVCPSPAAMVQKFTILPLDFSVLNEELTATQKLKRSVVEAKHTPFIDTMYENQSNTMYLPYVTNKAKL